MEEQKNKNTRSVAVEGIVSVKSGIPYINLFNNDKQIAQLTMSQARSFANNILTMCARTEADAMIFRFFTKKEFPQETAIALLLDFRQFRLELDKDVAEEFNEIPRSDQFDFTKKKPQ